MRTWRTIAWLALSGALLAPAAGARPADSPPAAGCQRAARRYETRCLMPRIAARLRLAESGGAARFVARMAVVEDACAEATAAGLRGCPQWPRVRPTPEYRRWLRDVQESWQREQAEREGARPACPARAPRCL